MNSCNTLFCVQCDSIEVKNNSVSEIRICIYLVYVRVEIVDFTLFILLVNYTEYLSSMVGVQAILVCKSINLLLWIEIYLIYLPRLYISMQPHLKIYGIEPNLRAAHTIAKIIIVRESPSTKLHLPCRHWQFPRVLKATFKEEEYNWVCSNSSKYKNAHKTNNNQTLKLKNKCFLYNAIS